MISKIRNFIKKQEFEPGLFGIMVNPFYIARKNLLENIKINQHWFKGGALLDVGCGIKPYEKFFDVQSYVGLDVEGGGHNDTAKKADVYYNGTTFPFDKSTFKYVISNQVLEHISDPDKFINEIKRVMKPGGLLFITVPFVWDEHEQPYDFYRYTTFGLKQLLLKHGFETSVPEKTGDYISTLTQLCSSYVYTIFLTKNKYFNLIVSMFICAPVLIIGLLLSKILPENKNIYLDNVILARNTKEL